MNNPWREMGFMANRRSKVHSKVVRIKKRLRKAAKKFEENQEKLIELTLRNRIMKLLVDELEKQLGHKRAKRTRTKMYKK